MHLHAARRVMALPFIGRREEDDYQKGLVAPQQEVGCRPKVPRGVSVYLLVVSENLGWLYYIFNLVLWWCQYRFEVQARQR